MINGKIHGIVVPLVTPLSTPDRIDEPGAERLIEHVISGGVHAIFLLGSTGEGPALLPEEQRRFLHVCVRAAAGRVPVLAGISGASGASAVELGKFAARAGVDAVVAAVPCFLPPEGEEIVRYYRRLAREIALPLLVYNMPSLTKVSLKLETLRRLAEIPGVVGYKDSSGDLAAFREAVNLFGSRPDFSLLVGPEDLTARAVALGGDGGVNGGANLFPERYVALYEAAKSGQMDRVELLQKEVLDVVGAYGSPATAASVIRRLKYELSRRGLIRNILAFPLLPMGDEAGMQNTRSL